MEFITKKDFLQFVKDLTKENDINILLQTAGGKWYQRKYTNDFGKIEVNKVYGISFGNCIMFDFKTTKNIDSVFKSFVNQYISKYMTSQMGIFDGEFRKYTKIECLNELKQSFTRISKVYFYSTCYGIGWFCFLSNDKQFNEVNLILENHLKNLNISFKNEFSEAGWVYRFLISKDLNYNSYLLNELNF